MQVLGTALDGFLDVMQQVLVKLMLWGGGNGGILPGRP